MLLKNSISIVHLKKEKNNQVKIYHYETPEYY